MKKNLLTCLLMLFTTLCITSCAKNDTAYSKTGLYFDTVVKITLYDAPDKNIAQSILDECFFKLEHYEKLFSRTLEGSDVYRINHSNGETLSVDPETVKLINEAVSYSKISDGTVDPTVGSLSSLWNIGSSSDNIIPSDERIKDALAKVGYENILISGNQITLLNDSMIDLGFIAKGYIADNLKFYLKDKGIGSAIIDLGGNIVLVGDKNGSSFRIGLKDPENPGGEPITTLDLTDSSIVSSGGYERFINYNGKRYHHILSLKDGYPAESDLNMVSIISDKSIDGDALSTICFILGKDKAVDFLNTSYPEVKAVFVDRDNNISYLNDQKP
ncbi:MAG: FAD:protein FMN transferase [Lachnospiraceae bacterium]|nr:FAD:protein FMN transferase [Lachnospiraceae bacterium]